MSLCGLIKICNPFVMFNRIEVSQIFKIYYYSQTTAMVTCHLAKLSAHAQEHEIT